MEIRSNPISPSSLYGSACSDCSTNAARKKGEEREDEKNIKDSNTDEKTQNNEKEVNKHAANPEQRLTEEQLKQLEELKQRDQEVRAHEAAHLAAAGQYAKGGPSFDYEKGPDGKNYAVGGEVSIDTSKVPNDPEATIQKAQQIRAAAMAPAEPSSQDRQVAAEAVQMEAQARAELQQQQTKEPEADKSNSKSAEAENDTDQNENTKNAATTAYETVASFDADKKTNIFEFVV